MRRFLHRLPSFLARRFLHSPANFRHCNAIPSLTPSLQRVTSHFVSFSSDSSSKLDEVVSKEELKKRIKSFLEDEDEDALPDLFEAMMNRKLSGKHDDSDDEVMEEVRKYPVNDVDVTDSDIESDDDDGLRVGGGDSSDSDIESNVGHLRDGDSSDSDSESDGSRDFDSSDSVIRNDDSRRNLDHSSYSDSESD